MENVKQEIIRFHVIASAIISDSLAKGSTSKSLRQVIVLPGSRSKLLIKKIDRDPILEQSISDEWRIVKFRHIRRLAENDSLTKSSFFELLGLDPISGDQIQAPLL